MHTNVYVIEGINPMFFRRTPFGFDMFSMIRRDFVYTFLDDKALKLIKPITEASERTKTTFLTQFA